MDERAREPEVEMEKRSAQLGGFNASTSTLGSNSWPITLLESVVFRVFGDKRRLRSSLAPALPASLTQILPLPPPPPPPQAPLKEDPQVTRKPNAIDTSSLLALACALLC